MNRYKFSEEEVPYGILESFGLTREMIGDLPVDVLQAILSGRRKATPSMQELASRWCGVRTAQPTCCFTQYW